MTYNWQRSDWPNFRYDLSGVEAALLEFADRAGQATGLLKALPDNLQLEAVIDLMIAEATKTSEIEGEFVNRNDVKSSIRNQLGLNTTPENVRDVTAQGVAELMVAVRNTWQEPLTEEMLFSWHQMLMRGKGRLLIGGWRDHQEPMQIVSGAIGKERVHYEAPPSSRIPGEMTAFIEWFNTSEQTIAHAPVRSAIAHLYFESIHPFEDGNGRIGRAISEKALSQGLRRPVLLSLSQIIEATRNAYYDSLGQAQQTTDATAWVHYFVNLALTAQASAEKQVDFVLRKAKFFDRHQASLNDRQLKIVRRMLEAGPEGFTGGMSARKVVAIAKTSKATATRDLQEMVQSGVLVPSGEGRSTSYQLNL